MRTLTSVDHAAYTKRLMVISLLHAGVVVPNLFALLMMRNYIAMWQFAFGLVHNDDSLILALWNSGWFAHLGALLILPLWWWRHRTQWLGAAIAMLLTIIQGFRAWPDVVAVVNDQPLPFLSVSGASFWLMLVHLGTAVCFVLLARRRNFSRSDQCCVVCDYDLSGVPEARHCPECGTQRMIIAPPSRHLRITVLVLIGATIVGLNILAMVVLSEPSSVAAYASNSRMIGLFYTGCGFSPLLVIILLFWGWRPWTQWIGVVLSLGLCGLMLHHGVPRLIAAHRGRTYIDYDEWFWLFLIHFINAILFGVLATRRRRIRRDPNICAQCQYDLRGNPKSERCPECGVPRAW